MKIVMLNGPKGVGKDEAAKQFVNAVRGSDLRFARVWPWAEIYRRTREVEARLGSYSLGDIPEFIGMDYLVVPDCYNASCGVQEAIALVGPRNVLVVNMYRDGYGWDESEGEWFCADVKTEDGFAEQEFELYNVGPIDELGSALARIVEAWEDGHTNRKVFTGVAMGLV